MKVYERIYQDQRAGAGDRTVWTLPFFYEGMIQKVVVKQASGAPVAFSIDIYNSKNVIDRSTSSGGGDPDGDYVPDPEMYRVFDTMQASAGEVARFLDNNGRGYRNMDGSQSLPDRKIYIEITIPSGSGDLGFDVCLGGWTDVG